jgi:hypothetical protein
VSRATKDPPAVFVEPLEGRAMLSAAMPHAVPVHVTPVVAGNSFIAEIADLVNVPPGLAYTTARITWGDGSQPGAQQSNPVVNDTIHLQGGHTFIRPGSYSVRVSFLDGNKVLGRTTTHIRATLNSPGGITRVGRTGQRIEGTFGMIDGGDVGASVQMQWGDGMWSMGALQSLGGGRYEIVSGHTYAQPGQYHVRAITASGNWEPCPVPGALRTEGSVGLGSEVDATVRVRGNPVTVPIPAAQITSDAPSLVYADWLNGPIAQITGLPKDPYACNPYALASWASGEAPAVFNVSVQSQGGKYVVSALHGFPSIATGGTGAGSYDVAITVKLNDHVDPTQNTTLGTIHETITTLPTTPGGLNLGLVVGLPFSGALGVLTAPAGMTPSKVTLDWGDGSTSEDAMISLLGNNQYRLSGSHTYSRSGVFWIVGSVTYGDPVNGGDYEAYGFASVASVNPAPTVVSP